MLTALVAVALLAAPSPLDKLDAIYPDLDALYQDLHRNPELSKQETKTAAKLADRLKALGFEVTTSVGGTGVVGVLKNGKGPTVMLRTDLDGLPVEELTGLTYASTVTTADAKGATVHVMHACGHDLHMASWIGAATLLSRSKDRWHGTLLMVGQPAEELVTGAKAMLADGLFTRFPKPDYALAIHDSSDFESGTVGVIKGFALANVDSVELVMHGRGGHGAEPESTIDPIVLAARTVLTLQTLVSRENDPLKPAVITVGSIHGGTKSNIIPDDVTLQITVRSYDAEVRKKLLAGIERVAKGESAASGAPEPTMKIERGPSAVSNDPALTRRWAAALRAGLGKDHVKDARPVMGAEDFGEFSREGVPGTMIWVGAVSPAAWVASKVEGGAPIPSPHSPRFAPDREAALKTGIRTLTLGALDLLAK